MQEYSTKTYADRCINIVIFLHHFQSEINSSPRDEKYKRIVF